MNDGPRHTLTCEPFYEAKGKTILGEGPVVVSNSLYWVDIHGGVIHSINVLSKEHTQYAMGEKVSAVVPCKSGDFLVALVSGIYRFNSDFSSKELIAHPETGRKGVRYNDGKAGPDGRLYIGSMIDDPQDREREPYSCSLWCVDPDGSYKKVVACTHVSNGMDWVVTEDGKAQMYYVDTPTQKVRAFDHDLETGELSNEKDLLNVADWPGYPDGFTLLQDGYLALAFFNGASVLIFDLKQRGKIFAKIELPVPQSTSIFVDGSRAYITTGREGYTLEEARKCPKGGDLFLLDLAPIGLKGRPPNLFRL